jgi:SAM-dependent methyltransferase
VSSSEHSERILDQFTRQAGPFATAPSIRDEAALRLVVEFSRCGADDTVLDVACGPGILACAFARVTRHVTGIDLTPAMLERARLLQAGAGPDEPHVAAGRRAAAALRRRGVHARRLALRLPPPARPGGGAEGDAPAAFNHMEVLRDPSHVRALPPSEHLALFVAAGLPAPRQTAYRLHADLASRRRWRTTGSTWPPGASVTRFV